MSECEGMMFEYWLTPDYFKSQVYICQKHGHGMKGTNPIQCADLVSHDDCIYAWIIKDAESKGFKSQRHSEEA